MQDSYKTLAIIAITISLMAIMLGMAFKNTNQNQFGSIYSGNQFSGGVTNSSTTLNNGVAATTTDANAQRQWMVICNDTRIASSSAVTAYLHFAATDTDASIGEGIALEDGECYEIDQDNLYSGQIWAVATDTAYITTSFK